MSLTEEEEFARDLLEKARAKKQHSPTCMPVGVDPNIVSVGKCMGWSFCIDVYDHEVGVVQPKIVEHYKLSARLFPPGRSSTEEDWAALGRIISCFGAPPEPLLPIEETHPNSSLMWLWHSDGSPVDTAVREGTARALAMLSAREQKTVFATAAQSDKVGRNDDCPCGSGRKFKKCHGGN